jgi:GNAT superfamily N-acetyltransferase
VNTRIVEHETASAFLDSCHEWLSKRELINHGVLSLANILTPHHPIYKPPFLFSHVTTGGEITGCCIYAEPDGLVLSECSPDTPHVLFDYLQSSIHLPSRVFGPEKPSLELAKLFGELRNAKYRIQSTWRIHRLDRLERNYVPVSGHLQIGKLEDLDLVREWGKSYNNERPANVDIQEFFSKKLRDNHLYFWIDEGPKSLATISGLNCSGPRISAVYTPPAHRTHGYATALVNHISDNYLDSGSAYITLNTQAGDPVERIYKRLGFYTIGEKVSVIFDDT